MKPVGIEESLSVSWRVQLGPRVAAALGLPSGPTYVLKDWPAGYHMFDHHKGPERAPRHDAYLIGSATVNRFRSINEFVPHAEWLCRDPTMDRSNCECKYCTKRPQKEISHGLGLKIHRGSASSTPQPTQRHRRAPPLKPPHASVRKQAKPYEKPLPGPKQALSSEKDSDIRDCLAMREIQGIRYGRNMELVWCALPAAISASDNEDEHIEFWPAIIEDFRTKSQAVPLEEPVELTANARRDPEDAPRPRINWKPQQRRQYTVRLLATEHVHTVSDDDILPYLAYAPSEYLLTKMSELLPEILSSPAANELANDLEKMSPFNPFSSGKQPGDSSGYSHWKEAILPFSLALQIASYLSQFWTPTDEWDCKLMINLPAESQHPPDYTPSLNDLINGHATGTAPSTGKIVTQLRYQGLWWGAERIWTEELVRLKLPRSQFVPQGSSVVYPPASPGKSTLEWWHNERGIQIDPQHVGSSDRGLFMKIDGLFVVEVPNKDGSGEKVKECRASGMIYELVDQDYEPEHGKGKERESAQPPSATAPPSQSTPRGTPPGSVSAPPTPSTKPRPVLSASFPLPDPPKGYKFNPILPQGHEVVLSLSLISGRYYPHLLKHPRMQKALLRAVQVPIENGGLFKSRHIWAMEGLLPGLHQSMEPEFWKPSRGEMIVEADRAARAQIKKELALKQEQQDYTMQDAFGPQSSQSISMVRP